MTHLVYVSFPAVLDVNRRLAFALARTGLKVTVVAPDSMPTATGHQIVEPLAEKGIELVALPRVSVNRTLRYRGIGQWISRHRPEAVLVEADPGSIAVEQILRATRDCGSRVACTSCEVEDRNYWRESVFDLRHGQFLTAAKKLAGATLERSHFGRIDMLFTYGPLTTRVYRDVKHYQGNIREIPLGVDTDAFSPVEEKRDAKPFTVAYMGRLVRIKSVEIMIDAAAMLSPKPNLMIDELYAEPDYRREIHRRVIDKGFCATQVMYFNPTHAEVPKYLAQADVVVLTPRKKPEQYGRAVAEAMAMGKPVIVSKSGHLPFLIADAGIVVEEDDVSGVAIALRKLHDPAYYRLMADRARKRAVDLLSVNVQAQRIAEWVNARS